MNMFPLPTCILMPCRLLVTNWMLLHLCKPSDLLDAVVPFVMGRLYQLIAVQQADWQSTNAAMPSRSGMWPAAYMRLMPVA